MQINSLERFTIKYISGNTACIFNFTLKPWYEQIFQGNFDLVWTTKA